MSTRTRQQIAEAIEKADGRLIDDEWRAWQAENFPARVRSWSRTEQRDWAAFRERALERAGYEVCPPRSADPHLRDYLAHGRTFDAYKARHARWKGRVSGCHSNVAELYLDGEIQQIGTGFCLDGDGLWRQHSWGLLGDWSCGDPRKELEIAETTGPRLLYYGVVLSPALATLFAEANYP